MKRRSIAASRGVAPPKKPVRGVPADTEAPPDTAQPPMRVLVMSHMDPRLSRGGAEIAAFQMYQELSSRPNVRAWFLSASGGKLPERLGVRLVQPFGPNEYVYIAQGFDHFLHANPDAEFPVEFAALLHELRPDVVHLHHYTNFGMEALHLIRRVLPAVRIIVTLHEYLAICHHFGQMVKQPSFALCSEASPRECHRCFPEVAEQEFFLRQLYFSRFLAEADAFIAPSYFLAQRYIEWGLPKGRFHVIENGMVEEASTVSLVSHSRQGRELVFGFFGQISRLKGANVLIKAAQLLSEQKDLPVRIEMYGDHSSQPEAFRKDFEALLAEAPANFIFRGPYENWRVRSLMRGVDAVVVPSIWWENSPLVIQEALASRRPIICSDIGGMAEKVRDGIDGGLKGAGGGSF
jgi:glycosyltransferase involved in cell wall biosynthesis